MSDPVSLPCVVEFGAATPDALSRGETLRRRLCNIALRLIQRLDDRWILVLEIETKPQLQRGEIRGAITIGLHQIERSVKAAVEAEAEEALLRGICPELFNGCGEARKDAPRAGQ